MHSVSPDLLRASCSFYADGKPKDPHAYHRAEHIALLRAQRRARWSARLRHVLQALKPAGAAPTPSQPVLHCKP